MTKDPRFRYDEHGHQLGLAWPEPLEGARPADQVVPPPVKKRASRATRTGDRGRSTRGKRSVNRVSDATVERASELYRAGMPVGEAAAAVGMHKATLYGRIRQQPWYRPERDLSQKQRLARTEQAQEAAPEAQNRD